MADDQKKRPMLGGDPSAGDPPLTSVLDDPLIVELVFANGEKLQPNWLGHTIEHTQPLNAIPTATIGVATAHGRLVNVGTATNPQYKRVEEFVTDDTLVRIRTDRGQGEAADLVLFEGFVEAIGESAGPRGVERVTLECKHVVGLLDEAIPHGTLFGQLQMSEQAERDGASHFPTHYEAEEAIFNPQSFYNCRSKLVPVTGFGKVPVFCALELGTAQPWTLCRALTYLLYWARRVPGSRQVGALGPDAREDGRPLWEDYATPERWTLTINQHLSRALGCNLGDKIGEIAERPNGKNPLEVDPRHLADATIADPWEAALLQVPASGVVDGMPFHRALTALCRNVGMSWVWRGTIVEIPDSHGGEPRREPGWLLELVPRQAGRMTQVYLPSPEYNTDGHTAEEIHAAANITHYTLISDMRATTNRVLRIGARRLYEVTVELVPGWKSDAMWDVDTADGAAVATALAAADARGTTDAPTEFEKRYVRSAASAESNATYAAVGRLWGINTHGAWSDYGRPAGRWTAAKYGIFDWGLTALMDEYLLYRDENGVAHYASEMQARRPRQIEAMLTGWGPRNPWAPVVELSLGVGAPWRPLGGDVQVKQRDFRIEFTAADMRAIALEGGLNFVQAYIRGVLRVRITCGVRGDFPPTVMVSGEDSLARRPRGRVLLARNTLREESREPDGGFFARRNFGNSQFRDQTGVPLPRPEFYSRTLLNVPAVTRDTQTLIGTMLDQVAHRGTIQLAGFVVYQENTEADTPVEKGYKPGDRVTAIVAQNDDAHSKSLATARNDRGYATIVRVTHQYALGDPRGGGGAALATTLQLDDGSFGVGVTQ